MFHLLIHRRATQQDGSQYFINFIAVSLQEDPLVNWEAEKKNKNLRCHLAKIVGTEP